MPTQKIDDNELFAKAVVEDLFREFGALEKRESPDFEGIDMGLEVTSACVPLLYQQKGDYMKSLMCQHQQPQNIKKCEQLKKKACGEHQCDGFRLCGTVAKSKFGDVHITTMCGDLHRAGVQWILTAVKQKCKKLNSGIYTVFGTNILFITTPASISTLDGVIDIFQRISNLYRDISDLCSVQFDIIIIYSESCSKIAILDFKKSQCGIADIDSHIYDAMIYSQSDTVLTREFDTFMKQLLFPKFHSQDGQ